MVYKWSEVRTRLQSWVLPPTCIACGGDGSPGLDLCCGCEAELPRNIPACARCGIVIAGQPATLTCGACLKAPPRFDRSVCAYRYEYPIDHLVRALKYGQTLGHARVLGELLVRQIEATSGACLPQCFIPVPLSRQRFRERGYNQAIEIGRFVEQRIRVPMRTDLIARIRHTAEQAGLRRPQRRQNVRGAFAALENRMPAHVAILDDVVTTGSTVNEIARVLRRVGTERIEVWACARAARVRS